MLPVAKMGFLGLPINIPNQRHRFLRSRILRLSCLALLFTLLSFHTPLLSNYSFELRTIGPELLQSQWNNALDAGLRRCDELQSPPEQYSFPVSSERTNPRWAPTRGQKKPVLQNATLFDGDSFLSQNVDILFEKTVIRTISPAGSGLDNLQSRDIDIQELNRAFVTPGLIDLHSHHLVDTWPGYLATGDVNEMHPVTGPLTPFV